MVVLESLVSLFLLLPLIRPLVKKLWPMDGLVWLPVLALAITIAIFPAYGFRPECIPLLLYGIILNIMNIPSLMSLLAHLKNDDFRERNRGLIFFLFVLLIFTAGTAIYFLPARDTALLADGVQSVTLSDDVRQEKLFVRVYTAEAVSAEPRPVMLLIPPVTGSVLVVDRICGALRDQGFTVITWSRRDFDLAALDGQGQIFRLPIQDLFALFRANSRGSISEAANEAGRFLETGRGSDISFLLDAIKIHRGLPDFDEGPGGATIDWTCIFAAGYGAGGAALLSLAGTPEFIAQNPALRGIITVESPPLSVLKGEDRPPAVISPQDTNWIHSLWTGVSADTASAVYTRTKSFSCRTSSLRVTDCTPSASSAVSLAEDLRS
ncbi:hypothetical protein AGMMS50267_10880 [Spirochaetia bacterium]|nr:hypothetical protein AGMMS50267_10880 [Spirochaetia bacterium]